MKILRRIVCVSAVCTTAWAAENAGTAQLPDPAFSVSHMDLSVSPAVDFAKFAAGGWYARTEMPPDKSRWGGMNELAERNWADLHAILEEVAANPGGDPVRKKVGDFFASATDLKTINARAIEPLAADLAAIQDAADLPALMRVAAQLQLRLVSGRYSEEVRPFFSLSFSADQKKSDVYGFYLSQGGLSLPSKEYYFAEKFARERWEFIGHVARIFEMAGDPKPTAYAQAETVFAFEKALAENAKLPVDLRDRVANYNKMTIAEAVKAFPGLALDAFVAEFALPERASEVIVGQPKFFEGLSNTLRDRPLAEVKTYLRWSVFLNAAPYLTEELARENFRFVGTVLRGTPAQEPRWQQAAKVIDDHMGEALGQLYVAKHFPPASKARVLAMIDNIRVVLHERLQKVDWMTEATRQKALAKLEKFRPMIGYPEQWRDYSAVEIKRDDYLGNVRRAARAVMRREIDRVGGPVDKREWRMTPPTVNAYFSPTENQIVFPAGILQPPIFDPRLDDAVNYGAVGAVIGHEITHGFDDQGRRYDAEGNLADWWTAEDAAKFRERAQRLVEQYNQFQALPGLAVNGQLSLGENIADLAGTSIAFEALQRSLRGKPTPPKIDGFTAEQRFFISYAQLWRTQYRDDAMRLQVARGPHAPGNFRGVGPLVNQPEFFAAFGIKEGDPMWRKPEERAKIW